jgi:F0F1-type ATP synthase membrane subunit a
MQQLLLHGSKFAQGQIPQFDSEKYCSLFFFFFLWVCLKNVVAPNFCSVIISKIILLAELKKPQRLVTPPPQLKAMEEVEDVSFGDINSVLSFIKSNPLTHLPTSKTSEIRKLIAELSELTESDTSHPSLELAMGLLSSILCQHPPEW